MTKPVVSIVIPTYNKVHLTISCLQSVADYTDDTTPYEVIIVDNGSSDGTRELLAQLGGDVQCILNDHNMGFGPACNTGAAASNSDAVLFLNNDTNVTPGWLTGMLRTLQDDPAIGALQPRLLYPDGRLNSAGDLVFRDQCWNYGKGHPQPYAPQFSSRRAVDYASGACLLVQKRAFDEIGGFDDRYAPAYYEDTDLSFSLRAAGYKTIYEPTVNIVHLEGGTAGTELTSAFKRKQMETNRQKFWTKWHDDLMLRPAFSPEILEEWAHRDQGRFAPLSETAMAAFQITPEHSAQT